MDQLIYLDNAATTAVYPEVVDKMLPYFTEQYGNPSSIYSFAGEARKAVTEAREILAKGINAKSDEIYFTGGGSESDNWALKATAEAYGDKGKHIITTTIEHHAILHTCEYLEKRGFEITYVNVDKNGIIKMEELKEAIRPDTILISVMTANNEIGTIQPIEEIGKIAREKGILFHTDAVQAFGHIPIDVDTASCIFLARHGVNKDGIRDYVSKEFGYDLYRTLDEIRPTYHHVESCQQTVPEAIIAFLESENYEDAVRNAVSLGGDTDTLAAITGSIAEAYYDMSAILRAECRSRVSEDILNVMQLFDETIGRRGYRSEEQEDLSGNAAIETAIHQVYAKDDKESFMFLLTMLCGGMKSKGHVLVPFVTVGEDMFSDLDVYQLKEGDTLTLEHDVRLHMDTVTEGKDAEWFYFFTGEEESRRQQCGNVIMSIPLYDMMEIAYKSDKVQGLVINPFGKYVRLTKELLGFLIKEFTDNWKEE